MNKKGKNKKGKVPIPPQEVKVGDKVVPGVISDEGNIEKPSEIVEEIIESVKEERVPEIISEIITPSIETRNEESPKKPRRNRGKKKKGKEDDIEHILEEEPKESDQKTSLDQINDNILEVDPLTVPTVAPAIRKKKNKRKNVEQNTEVTTTSDLEQVTTEMSTIEITKEPEVKQEISLQPDPAEQDIKIPKKKNKKKKRNDSETCEKEEISCTTAFQQLIAAQDEVSDLNVEQIGEDNIKLLETTNAESSIFLGEEISVKDTTVEKNTETQKEISTVEDIVESLPLPAEGKGKRKNKKDKKVLDCIAKDINKIVPEDIAKDIVDVEHVEQVIVAQETSPKPKAKIAKPVEKKRKGNQDKQLDECEHYDISMTKTILSSEQSKTVDSESIETLLKENETMRDDIKTAVQVDLQQPIDISISDSVPNKAKDLNLQEFELLNIVSEATGKKRKKGSKVPKTPDVSFDISDSQLEIDTKQAEFETLVINKEPLILSEQEKDSELSEVSLNPSMESKLTVEMIPLDTQKHVLLTPEDYDDGKKLFSKPLAEGNPVYLETPALEKSDGSQKNNTKSFKTRTKSPKPTQKDKLELKSTETATQLPIQTEGCIPTLEVTKDVEEKMDASNITRIYDIEISSIKADESDGSPCDTIPDVTYPRSISQQLMDDNNNSTVIREIHPVTEILLDTHKQENVETPKSDLKNKQTSPPKEEKTDIKSKMMEVNQDMEELRLSIERSLAELTAMEKNETETVIEPEESRITTEENLGGIEQDTICQKSDVEKTSTMNTIELSKIRESEQSLEAPLLLPDANELSTNIETQQPNSEVIQSEPTKCETESVGKEVITGEIKNISTAAVESKIDLPSILTSERPSENLEPVSVIMENKALNQEENIDAISTATTDLTVALESKLVEAESAKKSPETNLKERESQPDTPPVCPARKDHKNKHKKKKGKQDTHTSFQPLPSVQCTTTSQSATATQETQKKEKTDTENKNQTGSKDTQEKGKQQSSSSNPISERDVTSDTSFEPIDNFEDALTSSVDDINKTFELIVQETQVRCNPKINITAPDEEKSPVSPPKNLLGHPDIPVSSDKRDYKKEKDKIPNEITATVEVKDGMEIERKQTKNTQTANKLKDLKFCKLSENEEFIYKYSFRKVFLQSSCHVCKKDLAGVRLPCSYCHLVFYCGVKHKDEDWPLHQALCFAVSTIGHLKDQKHIYADTRNITGQDYRLIRMQMIVSCEKVLKRRLVPWEQEALLYPRVCAHVPCREWRQTKLSDCQGCGQISYCTSHSDHYPKSHSRWCKSYSLYQKLVSYQQTKGRLEPRLPTRVMQEQYEMPEKINEVLAAMYEEKIDMNDIQYAALTQLATAPLTAAYCYQLYRRNNITTNGYKKSIFTIHVVGAELQFEADALNKWEVFFLHLRPDLQELRVVLVNYNLNPSNLPLELLGKIKLCGQCRQDKRRVVMHFQDKRTYADYKSSEDFLIPDLICAFNPSIQRSSIYNGKDPWPSTVNAILKQKTPFIITSYTITELHKDCIRIKECSDIEFKFISEPKLNSFASVRPDRNFITDDEIPLLFKNYYYAIICG